MNKTIPSSIDSELATKTVAPINSTPCHNCVFAEYDDNNTQIACKANRLEKFQQANIPISVIEGAEGKIAFLIEGKVCVYYRNKDMLKTWQDHALSSKEYTQAIIDSDENLLQLVKSQLKIPYHAIVFVRSTDELKNVEFRLSELENQQIKPKIVTIVDRSHEYKDISGRLIMMCQEKYSFDHWRVQRIQAPDQIDTDVIDLVYDSTKQINYMFYIAFESSQPIPSVMSEEIHKSLHDDMKKFTILLPNSKGVGGGALKAAHAKHAGNSFTIPLHTKIIHYNDSPELITKVEEICPSLQTS